MSVGRIVRTPAAQAPSIAAAKRVRHSAKSTARGSPARRKARDHRAASVKKAPTVIGPEGVSARMSS